MTSSFTEGNVKSNFLFKSKQQNHRKKLMNSNFLHFGKFTTFVGNKHLLNRFEQTLYL